MSNSSQLSADCQANIDSINEVSTRISCQLNALGSYVDAQTCYTGVYDETSWPEVSSLCAKATQSATKKKEWMQCMWGNAANKYSKSELDSVMEACKHKPRA